MAALSIDPKVKHFTSVKLPMGIKHCVYILYSKNKPVYIGRSARPIARWGDHIYKYVKEFDEVRYIEVINPWMAESLEYGLIKILPTKYNKEKFRANYELTVLQEYVLEKHGIIELSDGVIDANLKMNILYAKIRHEERLK